MDEKGRHMAAFFFAIKKDLRKPKGILEEK